MLALLLALAMLLLTVVGGGGGAGGHLRAGALHGLPGAARPAALTAPLAPDPRPAAVEAAPNLAAPVPAAAETIPVRPAGQPQAPPAGPVDPAPSNASGRLDAAPVTETTARSDGPSGGPAQPHDQPAAADAPQTNLAAGDQAAAPAVPVGVTNGQGADVADPPPASPGNDRSGPPDQVKAVDSVDPASPSGQDAAGPPAGPPAGSATVFQRNDAGVAAGDGTTTIEQTNTSTTNVSGGRSSSTQQNSAVVGGSADGQAFSADCSLTQVNGQTVTDSCTDG